MVTKIQEKVGIVGLVCLLVLFFLTFSWVAVNLLTYGMSVMFAGSVFAFDWTWNLGTGFWFLFLLISMATGDNKIKISG